MAQKKIVMVEDDKMLSNMYQTKLKQEGYNVFVAEDGSAGLETAIREKPDLVLLDVILPQLDGFTVLQEMRLNSNLKKIPILMLTNLGTTEDKEKAEKFGATDYLVKANLTPGQVSEMIKKYLS
jgi:two-component system phosphate regulon response regulator PhoB